MWPGVGCGGVGCGGVGCAWTRAPSSLEVRWVVGDGSAVGCGATRWDQQEVGTSAVKSICNAAIAAVCAADVADEPTPSSAAPIPDTAPLAPKPAGGVPNGSEVDEAARRGGEEWSEEGCSLGARRLSGERLAFMRSVWRMVCGLYGACDAAYSPSQPQGVSVKI